MAGLASLLRWAEGKQPREKPAPTTTTEIVNGWWREAIAEPNRQDEPGYDEWLGY